MFPASGWEIPAKGGGFLVFTEIVKYIVTNILYLTM
jgi:hypothetical protein